LVIIKVEFLPAQLKIDSYWEMLILIKLFDSIIILLFSYEKSLIDRIPLLETEMFWKFALLI